MRKANLTSPSHRRLSQPKNDRTERDSRLGFSPGEWIESGVNNHVMCWRWLPLIGSESTTKPNANHGSWIYPHSYIGTWSKHRQKRCLRGGLVSKCSGRFSAQPDPDHLLRSPTRPKIAQATTPGLKIPHRPGARYCTLGSMCSNPVESCKNPSSPEIAFEMALTSRTDTILMSWHRRQDERFIKVW